MNFTEVDDERNNIRYLLQNVKLLEKFHLTVEEAGWSFVELLDMLSLSARTLKILDLKLSFLDNPPVPQPLGGLCEAMAGHNTLEALSLEVELFHESIETHDFIGSTFQDVEKVLVKPGWSALRQVSFKVSITFCNISRADRAKFLEALQSLPDNYLSHLPKLESVAFNFSAYDVRGDI
jgi:hypothetical protein